MKPRLLDLFCGAGGAAMGYHRAGFEVVGVDIATQPHYPFRFIQADALEFLRASPKDVLSRFDAVHASPPCQAYSRLSRVPWIKVRSDLHPKLIDEVCQVFTDYGRPWVIENVEDAPLQGHFLCGVMFGLGVFRHRLFECSNLLMVPPHESHRRFVMVGAGKRVNDKGKHEKVDNLRARSYHLGLPHMIGVYGKQFRVEEARKAMGIDWMNRDELRLAIPPAYTEWIGRQLLEWL
jgi:DNA (cytosine-5)-methyltransferase 1